MISPFLSPTQAWQLLGWTMILFLAAGTVVLIIGGMLRVILKRANPSVRYSASLAVFAVLALLPVAIAFSVGREAKRVGDERFTSELTTNHTNQLLNAEVPTSAEIAEVIALTNPPRQQGDLATEGTEDPEGFRERILKPISQSADVDYMRLLNLSAAYLPYFWFVGTPLTFLLLATGLIGAERLRKTCNVLDDGPIRAACDELQKSLRIGRRVSVAVCERIATPILVGVIKPLVLLPPAALNGWTTAELEMVLVHELAHVRRWDNAVNLGQRIVESLLFFHPAVWIVSGWVRQDREDCCDAVVVCHTAKPQAYAELLLALASSEPRLATSAALARHPVAHRIRRILKLEDETMLVTRKGFTIAASAVVAVALLAFALPTTDAEESASRVVPDPGQKTTQTTNPTRQRGEEETTNQTNDTNQEDFTTEDTEGTEEEPETRETWAEVPGDVEDLASVKESLSNQGFKSRFEKVVTEEGRHVNVVWITVPKDTKHRVVFEEHPDGLRARVILFDESGKTFVPANSPPLNGEPYPEQITYPTGDTNPLSAEAAKSAEDAEKNREITVDYTFAYHKADEVYAELLETFKGGDKFRMTGDDEQITVTAKQAIHDKVINFFASKGIAFKASTEEQNPLFPTLEEQRAADLAYKLLGVELEKLTSEELERAKAKGYRGGLKVTQTKAIAENGLPPWNACQAGDLLVGLHVWPTESLTEVTQILSRIDIEQLAPLKFYVVRGGAGRRSAAGDQVGTGRIQVDLDAWRAMREPALKQLVALEKQIQNELAEKEGLRDDVPAVERALHDAEIDQLREILQSIGRKIALQTSQGKETKTADERLALLAEGPGRSVQSNSPNPFGGETDLLYDGKTFDEWRNLWKTELKIEKRIECIKALAAFGRAGKGKEAAEAILDVAAEYDFGKGEGDSATNLKSAISEVLSGAEGIPAEHWLPLYIERLKSNPDQWSAFADWVLAEVSGKNVLEHLQQIAVDESLPAKPRNAALAGMSLQPEVADDTEAVALVREGLLRNPPVMEILHKLQFDRMDLFPQQVEPLLDREKSVRNQALQLLQSRMHPMRGGPVLDELLKLIDDPSRAADHAYAINAIGQLGFFFNNDPAMGKRKQEVTRRLAKILVDGDEELISVTLMSMSTISGESADQLVETGLKNLGDKISDERREQLKKAADEVEQWTGGDGGMGRGGYGAEMGGGGAF